MGLKARDSKEPGKEGVVDEKVEHTMEKKKRGKKV